VRVGDKISLFDVIMDVIPTPDIRPRVRSNPVERAEGHPARNLPVAASSNSAAGAADFPVASPPPPPTQFIPPSPLAYPANGNAALQLGGLADANANAFTAPVGTAPQTAFVPQLTLQQKIENYIENVLMPSVYKLGVVFSFRQILQAFVLTMIVAVTLLSAIPLTNIISDSNFKEAAKRAQSVARAMAKLNEQALLSGQINNLNVQEAMKEEGIKEAYIVQHSDGLVVAPPEKAGREDSNPIVLKARREQKAVFAKTGQDTISATFPILVWDPTTGEATPKYHAIVVYNSTALDVDDGRVASLFMQTLIIASIFGLLLYQLFARLIEFPIKTLNAQIEKALIDKTDKTEVAFDYPAFQHLISNVNTILNRAWNGDGSVASLKPQQNKDIEFANLVDMIAHPVIVVDTESRVVAMNTNFEQLTQQAKEMLLNQSFQQIPDIALVQNIESLVARAKQSPYEKQMDRIPFSQFECEIYCQAFLNAEGEAQYFVLTLVQVTE
jgi:hypothetical protein